MINILKIIIIKNESLTSYIYFLTVFVEFVFTLFNHKQKKNYIHYNQLVSTQKTWFKLFGIKPSFHFRIYIQLTIFSTFMPVLQSNNIYFCIFSIIEIYIESKLGYTIILLNNNVSFSMRSQHAVTERIHTRKNHYFTFNSCYDTYYTCVITC